MTARIAIALFVILLAAVAGSGEPDPYQHARHLRSGGYEEEARAALVEASKLHPEVPVPSNLHLGNWANLHTLLEQLPALVTGVFLCAVLVILLWQLGRKAIWKLSLHYEFATVGQIAAPEAISAEASSVRARIADELDSAGSPVGTMVQPTLGGGFLPALIELPQQVRFLGPLISWLRQPPHVKVSGTLHKRDEHYNLSIEVTNERGRVLNRDYFPTATPGLVGLERLTVYAAAWAAFDLQGRRKGLGPNEQSLLIGTAVWQSYAALKLSELGDSAAHERQALELDPRNVGALLRVGSREAEAFDDRPVMNRGISRLQFALSELDRRAQVRRQRFLWPQGAIAEPQWYQAMYALCVAHLHRFSLDEAGDTEVDESDLVLGLELAAKLAQTIGTTAVVLTGWGSRSLWERERSALRVMLGCDARYLVGVLASAKAAQEYRSGALLKGTSSARGGLSDVQLWPWLEQLDAQALPPALDLMKALDQEFLGSRARYNQACFYARARMGTESLQQLELSFENQDPETRRGHAEWAWKDPSLILLRRQHKAAFEQLMDRVFPKDVPEAPPPSSWEIRIARRGADSPPLTS